MKLSQAIWRLFLLKKVLNKQERFFALLVLVLAALSLTGILLLKPSLQKCPSVAASGGTFKEAIMGFPRYLNPLLSYSNDPDRDVVSLVYSGLMKFNSEGKLVPDLAQKFTISNNGKTYDFSLKKNVLWQDGQPFNADDVIFTIRLIQDPQYNSPLRVNWEGVEAIKIDNWTVRLTLRAPYTSFLANTTVGIIPRHIWKNVPADKFATTAENSKPIGTGPFKIESMRFEKNQQNTIKEIILKKNLFYYQQKPYLQKIVLTFHPKEQDLIQLLNKNKVSAINLSSAFYLQDIRKPQKFNISYIFLPRYFAVFFNSSHIRALSNKNLRLALAYATDKEAIIQKIFHGKAIAIENALPHYFFPNASPYKSSSLQYNLQKATEFLKKAQKQTKIPELTIIVPDIDELVQTAQILQANWIKIGLKVKISPVSPDSFVNKVIRPRQYGILLFGQALSLTPDPFSFWHSSQINDPGLNLALYANKKVDENLEKARQETNQQKQNSLYRDFQAKLSQDLPAIFLYDPAYVYLVNKKIKGVGLLSKMNLPSDRFSNINSWYTYQKKASCFKQQ